MTTGIVKFIDANKFGYTPTLNVNGVKYGGDTKLDRASNLSAIQSIKQGDTVEFESFSTESNGKTYQKYKAASLKIVPADKATTAAAASGARNFGNGSAATPAVDWDAKDARISYQGALERAIRFTDLALKYLALPLPKADNKKLEVLQAFVDEQALKYHTDSYAATTPAKKAAKVLQAKDPPETEQVAETDEDWS